MVIGTEEDLMKVRSRYFNFWKIVKRRSLTKSELLWFRDCSDAIGVYRREYKGKISVDESMIER